MQNELSQAELQDAWPLLLPGNQLEDFRLLAQADADDFFLSLNARNQAELLLALPEGERRLWLRLLQRFLSGLSTLPHTFCVCAIR